MEKSGMIVYKLILLEMFGVDSCVWHDIESSECVNESIFKKELMTTNFNHDERGFIESIGFSYNPNNEYYFIIEVDNE